MLRQYGTNYGGFCYPSNLNTLNKDSIIYCVGAGEDISHDIELARQLGCEVYIFDPTPRAIEHVDYIKKVFAEEVKPVYNKRMGGGDVNYLKRILANKIDPEKIKMFDYGLYTEDKTLKFYEPSNKESVSHSVVPGMRSNDYIEVEVKKLKTIMEELGHEKIDLLKIDIEGCECDVLEQMVQEKIFPTYLSVDFDLGWCGEKLRDRKKCLDTIEMLKSHGYHVIHSHRADYSFVMLDRINL